MKFIHDKIRIAATIFLGILLLFVFAESLFVLGYQWFRTEDYWRFFIFPISVYLLWYERRRLLNIDVSPSYWYGISLFALGCISFLVWNITTIDLSIEIGIVLLALGTILLLYGIKAASITWVFVCYFLIATSLTDRGMSFIAIYFQNISAILSSSFLNATAWPVLCVERSIRLPHGILEVARACSGTAQLTALIAFAIPLGYFRQSNFWLRIILVMATFPITIFFNTLRIVLIAIWNYNGMHELVHGPNDILKLPIIFPFALLMVYGVSVFLERFEKKQNTVKKVVASSDSGNFAKFLPEALPLGIAISLLLVAFGAILYYHPKPVFLPTLQHEMPLTFNGWTGSDINNQTGGTFLGKPDYELNRRYLSNEGDEVDLQIAYFNDQSVSKRITTQYSKVYCREELPIVITLNDLEKVTMKVAMCTSNNRSFVQISWFVSDGKVYYNGSKLRKAQILKLLKTRKNNAAFVTLTISSLKNVFLLENTNGEQINKIVNEFYPFIDSFLEKGTLKFE
jgi:EpsI family protein